LNVGRLAKGHSADLVIYNPQSIWQVRADQLHSAGKNSPFIGWEFNGRVETTLFQGRPVYRADDV
jgi:dihydroorotase